MNKNKTYIKLEDIIRTTSEIENSLKYRGKVLGDFLDLKPILTIYNKYTSIIDDFSFSKLTIYEHAIFRKLIDRIIIDLSRYKKISTKEFYRYYKDIRNNYKKCIINSNGNLVNNEEMYSKSIQNIKDTLDSLGLTNKYSNINALHPSTMNDILVSNNLNYAFNGSYNLFENLIKCEIKFEKLYEESKINFKKLKKLENINSINFNSLNLTDTVENYEYFFNNVTRKDSFANNFYKIMSYFYEIEFSKLRNIMLYSLSESLDDTTSKGRNNESTLKTERNNNGVLYLSDRIPYTHELDEIFKIIDSNYNFELIKNLQNILEKIFEKIRSKKIKLYTREEADFISNKIRKNLDPKQVMNENILQFLIKRN